MRAPSGDSCCLRASIDDIDARTIALLQKRANLAVKTGEIKTSLGLQVHDPGRERTILNAIAGSSSGPLPADSVQRIFETIIRECRELEEEEGKSAKGA